MAACALEWVPDSLYNTTVSALVTHFSRFGAELRILPDNVQFDIYYQVSAVYVYDCHPNSHLHMI